MVECLSQLHPFESALNISGRGAADAILLATGIRNHTCFGVSSTEFPAGPARSSTELPCPSLLGAMKTAFAWPGLQTLKSHQVHSPVSGHRTALGPSPCAQPLNPRRTRAPGRHQALPCPTAPGPGAHRGNRWGPEGPAACPPAGTSSVRKKHDVQPWEPQLRRGRVK